MDLLHWSQVPPALAVLALLPLALLLALAGRHRTLQRAGGTVELALQLPSRSGSPGRGWTNGIGQFVGDELRWYRVFSLWWGPRRTVTRSDLEVVGRRSPSPAERRSLQAGVVVLSCRTAAGPVELALQSQAVTGLLAWLEGRAAGDPPAAPLGGGQAPRPPPGSHSTSPPGFATRDRMNSRSDSRLR